MAISFGYANFQVPARLACPPKLVLEISLCPTPRGFDTYPDAIVVGERDVERVWWCGTDVWCGTEVMMWNGRHALRCGWGGREIEVGDGVKRTPCASLWLDGC